MRKAKEYDNKRKIAHHYYVEKNYTAKQVAEMLDITPKTVGEWVRKYAWKQERQAREISVRSREGNRDQVLSDLATDRRRIRELIMEQEASPQPDRELIRELRKQISRIDDAVSKWNKARITAQKDERVPLDIYLQVMDNIFDSLRLFDMELYTRTLDFQEQHIYQISNNK